MKQRISIKPTILKKSEAPIQRQCVAWLRIQHPSTRGQFFEVNNNPKNKIDGVRRKKMGMVAGVSDLMLLRKDLPPLCIEMKNAKGTQSTAQKEWQKVAESFGCVYVICRSLDEFKKIIEINLAGY